METNTAVSAPAASSADVTVVMDIPTLAGSTLPAATFAAFKADERFSFVRAYDPKVTGITGYRHAVIRYRNTEKNTVIKAAQMVTVPQMKLSDDYLVAMSDKAQKVFLAALEDAEDSIIRGFIDEPVKASMVRWIDVGMEKALDFLTAERVSQRLNKEQIENWATVAIKSWTDARADEICTGKNITKAEDIAKQKAGTFNAYKDRLVKLAAPVPNLGQSEAMALKNMLTSAKLDDDMAKVLGAKLKQMLEPKVVESGDL